MMILRRRLNKNLLIGHRSLPAGLTLPGRGNAQNRLFDVHAGKLPEEFNQQ
ncbi:hypothetical protein [Pontibacter beigongshangensis]|uniref:hypothetical protein n=1 Tax=Pontibacter beigongshangensis TaxID=2574733 RepID=UPI001650B2B0|nr:hypothetical protein [Pontibacter beigongshangensis]